MSEQRQILALTVADLLFIPGSQVDSGYTCVCLLWMKTLLEAGEQQMSWGGAAATVQEGDVSVRFLLTGLHATQG